MDINKVKLIFSTLKKGQSIFLETEKQKLIGRLHHVDINWNFVLLDIVKDVKANVAYTSRQMIPAEMVKSIEVLKDIADTPSTSTSASSHCSADYKTVDSETEALTESELPCPTANLSTNEIKSIQSRIDNPVIINQNGQEYVKALADIRAQQFIALFIEPAKYGRNFKTSIITVATVQNVYIFDVICLGKLFTDLKNVLESQIPRKAIHCSHFIADHLKYQHNVQLNGIFDTFVAYCIVTKQKRQIDFVDIIEQFFNIDKQFFQSTVVDDLYYPQYTFERPMSRDFITDCAKRACLILKLQEHLQNKMLSKFYNQCKDFSHTFINNENYAVVTNTMQTSTSAGFDTITGIDPRDQTI